MSKVRYSTNWMGPVSLNWYSDRGLDYNTEPYSCGRIDVRGGDLGPYGDELGVPPIRSEDWKRLSDWLDTFETDEMWEFRQVVWLYEKENPPIRWYETPEWYPYNPHEVKE